jgi:hypothetical protein
MKETHLMLPKVRIFPFLIFFSVLKSSDVTDVRLDTGPISINKLLIIFFKPLKTCKKILWEMEGALG